MPSPAAWWSAAADALDGLPGGGLNICHEAVDRHADGPEGDRTALRWAGGGPELSYRELRDRTAQFAGLLAELGVQKGETVFVLAERRPELYIAALGALRAGCVFCPLFSSFGPDPILSRLTRGDARVLVTTRALYDKKVAPLADQLPEGIDVLIAGEDLEPRMAAAAPLPCAPTRPEDPALLHFTSGTTGMPKGALHVHRAVIAHHATARLALGLRDGDVFWCTADPGWVTGTTYGIIAPLTCGATTVVDDAAFEAARWYDILEHERVAVWYTAPTAIRMLMRAGDEPRAGRTFPSLRHVASVGEPLGADAVHWGEAELGQPIHDTWWQTETGAIMVANLPGATLRAGAIGRPLPGVEVAIVARDEESEVIRLADGGPQIVTEPDATGELALRLGWPSMFVAYLHDEERYAQAFAGDWYLSGDLARRDADGYVWFVGRGDDVIKTAGHLIGPYEVESVLLSHPAVVEAAVIGLPDPIAGQVVAAKVVLRSGFEDSPALIRELRALARSRLGATVAPRTIEVVPDLPHTRSGKIMRRLVRSRTLGLPDGDLSTLERTE